MERARVVIAETEPGSAPEPRRSLLRWWFGWKAA
jgi:hypothetical protein